MNFNNETYAKQMKVRWIDSWIDSIVVKKRNEMWELVTKTNGKREYLNFNEVSDCLDVGATSDTHYESSNLFLSKMPKNIEISIFSDQKISKKSLGSEIRIIESFQGSISSKIDLAKSYDLVTCSATLEHIGSLKNQELGMLNLLNLASKYLFITVPNRWHPIEFHSRLPLIHWLPEKLWRKIFSLVPSLKNLSEIDNLNFISPKMIKSLLSKNIKTKSIEVFRIRLFGFTSNYAILVSIKGKS